MSLFPGVDNNIATITQPKEPPTQPKYKVALGGRLLKSTPIFGKIKCERVKEMIRYIKRQRRFYLFWSAVATLTLFVLLVTNSSVFYNTPSAVYKRSAESSVHSMDQGVHLIVEKGSDVTEMFPDLPIPPPVHKQERPIIAHYLWCGQRLFEFRHYLSIKSVDRVIVPYKIMFHYINLPMVDTEGYFTWFNQTLMDVPDIILNKLDRSNCPTSGSDRYLLVLDILYNHGGIYVPDNVLLVEFPQYLRTKPFASNVIVNGPSEYQDGIIVAKANDFVLPLDSKHLYYLLTAKDLSAVPHCVGEDLYEHSSTRRFMCVNIDKMIFPKDIWTTNTKFALLSRVIAYNTMTIQPAHDLRTPFPKIAHYICAPDCELEFITYVSILSSLFVAKLDRVYIHVLSSPGGQWWEKLQNQERVVLVRHPPSVFEGSDLASLTREPCPLRLEILLRYGGIYVDGNVLWTNSLPDYYFGYSAIVTPDWHLYGNWPESINPSIIMGKQDSSYLIKLERFLRSESSPVWFKHHYGAYHILEAHPQSVFMDRRLQVKCLNHNCHPTWLEDYRSELHQNMPGNSFDWRNDTFSVHWIDSLPVLDIDMVKYLSGIPVEIARFVFQAAHIDINTF